jgi:hypothetical protein
VPPHAWWPREGATPVQSSRGRMGCEGGWDGKALETRSDNFFIGRWNKDKYAVRETAPGMMKAVSFDNESILSSKASLDRLKIEQVCLQDSNHRKTTNDSKPQESRR